MLISPRISAAVLGICIVSIASAQAVRRELAINQSRYTVTAGERVPIPAPAESVAFAREARTRSARASGHVIRNFAVGPNIQGDQILLGAPFTTEPGEYSAEISFVNAADEERTAAIQVMVEPFAAAVSSSVPPVVLLDGFQAAGCPMSNNSSGTFGNLQAYLGLSPNSNPNVYFFENCTECPNCTIEQLGADLGVFLNLLGVAQVDVVAHSMGGLIIRAYLSGKQGPSGVFSPPLTPKIRKAVFVATPHFGSFQADSVLSSILFSFGTQDNEMKRGSQFIWDLATWNQFGDDLRGVDAVSVVGNAGPSQQSDGVVYSTSASLDFASRGRTRVISYCHIPASSFGGLAGLYTGCNAPGIADVDSTSHPTYQIVSSFLLSGTAWNSVGNAPSQDPYLLAYGGMLVADVTSSDQYVVPSSESWGNVKLTEGAASPLFYNDFVGGTATFNFGSSTCGPYTVTVGTYSTVRCKFAPSIYSVGPLLPSTGREVQAGGTITISGVGFGAQQCATCRVTAANPTAATLQVLSWSDGLITALLPASFGIGIATIGVTAASGSDAINIIAGTVVQPPTISLSMSSLSFAYTVGGTTPSAQSVSVSNTGGGNLSYTVTSNAAWLTASASGSTILVSVSPAGLAANTYQGSVTISAPGASNTPQTISVSLVVTGATLPSVVITGIRHAATGLTGPIAPGELVTIVGTGLGPNAGTVFSVDPATGMVDSTLAGTRVFFGSLAGPILYTSSTQINAIAPYELAGQSQVGIQVQYQGSSSAIQSVQVVPASPGAFTLNSGGFGSVVAANQDGTINGPGNPAMKGSYVTIFFTGGGQTNPPGVTGSVTGVVLKWLTQGISVTVGGQLATVSFDGSAPTFADGVDQLNIQLSPNTPSGAQPIAITMGGISSPSSVTLAVQ